MLWTDGDLDLDGAGNRHRESGTYLQCNAVRGWNAGNPRAKIPTDLQLRGWKRECGCGCPQHPTNIAYAGPYGTRQYRRAILCSSYNSFTHSTIIKFLSQDPLRHKPSPPWFPGVVGRERRDHQIWKSKTWEMGNVRVGIGIGICLVVFPGW